MMLSENVCENCHKKAKRQFKIIEPGVTYKINGSNERENISGTFCTAACAKAFAAWMCGPGLAKMPKGWKIKEIKDEPKRAT